MIVLVSQKKLPDSSNPLSYIVGAVHSAEHEFLRHYLKRRREELGFSQRALGTRMGVIYSFIGKVETGDRRLDVIEFIEYCQALELDAADVINLIQNQNNAQSCEVVSDDHDDRS